MLLHIAQGEASAVTSRQFNGDGDYISAPSWGSDLPVVTIETWVLFESTSGNHPIMNDDDWSRGDVHYQIYASVYGFDVNGNGDRSFDWQPTAGEWNLLTVTYSVTNNYIKLTVNGLLQETLNGQASVNVNFANPRIGGWLAGSNQARSLDGQIANFRVWSVEVNSAGSCASDLPPDGLLAAYEFSDSDDQVVDLSSNRLHATASGASVVTATVCAANGICKAECTPAASVCVDVSTGNTQTYDRIIADPNFLGPEKAITFTVQARNDAHIGFFSDARSTGEVYEIVLSGWGNTRSTIRQSNQGINNLDSSCQGTAGTLCTQDLLSEDEMRPFWASARDGLVQVGTGSVVGSEMFMEWQDPEHHVASYVGFMTGWGATGEWRVCPAGAAAASDCRASTDFVILGSTTRADNDGAPGWFELAELRMFTASGENVAPQATITLLLEPSNPDSVDVITDGEVFDWTSGRFVVWQNDHNFHGEALVRISFPTPQVIVGAELYSTNYESFGSNAQIIGAGVSVPIRFVYSAHANQGAAHAACYENGVELSAPCATLDDESIGPYGDLNMCAANAVVNGFAHMRFNDQDWYLVRRVTPGTTWHPINDRLSGTTSYGEQSTDSVSGSTFSVPFGDDFTEFLLASGDMSMWVTMTKAELYAQCAASCANCQMTLTGSSHLENPRQYCRTGNAEDPWISAGDHPAQIVYGENSYGGHNSDDALNFGGANVWVNALPG
eukprot:SAG31_NODE_996_length_10492_cov_4.648802_6_plen_728_part_00